MLSPALDSARRHPLVTGVVGAIATSILVRAYDAGDLTRAVAYLIVIAVSVAIVDLLVGRSVDPGRAPSVRGAALETAMLVVSFAGGAAWLYARFVAGYQPAPGLLRLVWLALLIAGVFN